MANHGGRVRHTSTHWPSLWSTPPHPSTIMSQTLHTLTPLIADTAHRSFLFALGLSRTRKSFT